MIEQSPNYIYPDWPEDLRVSAITSTRIGGVSQAPYHSFNLAEHVGDKQQHVSENRALLTKTAKLPSEPFWLNQIHGTDCVKYQKSFSIPIADSSFAKNKNQVLAVMTADCLPILFKSNNADWVAACHAGWRGLLNGVVESTLNTFHGPMEEIVAWIGPAISKNAFEVGDDVRQMFVAKNKSNERFFEPKGMDKYWFDFVTLAKQFMASKGINVYGGNHCTYRDEKQFYSYRRDGETGRIASLIWINE